jgi:N-methylhydantoinase A
MRDRLPHGSRYEGPVVIEEQSSTTVVPPGHSAALDEHSNVVITRV